MKKTLFYLMTAMVAGGLLAGTEIYNAVFYGTITAGGWTAISDFTLTSATNGDYTNAATYYYRLSATNSLGRFPYTTNEVKVTIDGTVTNGATLTWTYASRLTHYVIERGTNGTDWTQYITVSPAVTSAFDDGNLSWSNGSITGLSVCTTSSFEQIVSTNHNTLPGLQGGITDEYYHLDAADYAIATNADTRMASIEGDVTTLEGQVISNAYSATGSSNNAELDGQQVKVTFKEGGEVYRYSVITTASEQAYVLASQTNVTAARSSTTITLTIPADTIVWSLSGRWNAPVLGASFKLVVGTNDMLNADITDQFACSFVAYREDTGRAIVGASATLDMVNFDRFTVEGLPTATVCKYHFGF